MFGLPTWLWVAAGIAIVSFGAGYKTRDLSCDAAYWKAENAKNVAALRTATLGASLSASLQTELDTERDKTDELQRQYDDASKDKSCPASDADRAALSRIMRDGN